MNNIIIIGLRFLVRISTDLGMKEVQEYVNKLSKLKAISNNNNSINNVNDLMDSLNNSTGKLNKSKPNIIENSTGTFLIFNEKRNCRI